MKKIYYSMLLLLVSAACFGQGINEKKLKSLLIGEWRNLDDSALTVKITQDSIIQCTNGIYAESDLYTYHISRKGCQGNCAGKSSTGYYVNEKDTDDGENLCGSIQSVSKDQITIVFADDLLVLKRMSK
jgi:hypothetical protein